MGGNRTATALLVDDDPETQQVNSRRLEDDGYSVVLARNENEGLARAKQAAPEVIFVHLGSTQAGNLPFIQSLRSDDSCRHIRVVVLRSQRHEAPMTRLWPVPRDGG